MACRTLEVTVVPDRSFFALQTRECPLLSRFPGRVAHAQSRRPAAAVGFVRLFWQ
jgi:hypothetical protein